MGLEEQQEEREVLASIFPDEITEISPTTYTISITLDLPSGVTTDRSTPPTTTLNLHIAYPATYPDVAPVLDLSFPPPPPPPPPNARTNNAYLSLPDDRSHLLSTLEPVISENLGMAMIFTLVSALKDSAEALMAERQRKEREEREEVARRLEAEENRRFHGEKVTRDGFERWRERFKREMILSMKVEGEEGQVGKREERKLTGRELWERGLVGRVDADEEEGGLGVEEMERLRVEG